MYDMGEFDNPDYVDAAQQANDARRDQQLRWVQDFMSTYNGRAFMDMLLAEAPMGVTTFAGEAPLTMAVMEGRRQIGLWAENWAFTAAPEEYNIMKREALAREQQYEAASQVLNNEGTE